MVIINESPREAFQSSKKSIPVSYKTEYINSLFKVGFSIVELGGFGTPSLMPQMSDTPQILKLISDKYDTKISVLTQNLKFAEQIAFYDCVDYINYHFPLSETFLIKNLNSNYENALNTVDKLINLCHNKNKNPIISLSWAFGNPFDDDWGIDILMEWVEILYETGIRFFPLIDTDGSGSDHLIGLAFENLTNEFPDCEFNLHLHSIQDNAMQKIESAWHSGCKNFNSVINGPGGYSIPDKGSIPNLDTLKLIDWLDSANIEHKINKGFLNIAVKKASEIF